MMSEFVNSLSAIATRIRHPDIFSYLEEASERQWWAPEKLVNYQSHKLNELLKHCKEHIPYYQEIAFASLSGRTSSDALSTLQKLPILTKDILRTEGTRLKAASPYVISSIEMASGGSTGTPVRFLTDTHIISQMEAHLRLLFTWAGWNHGEMVLHFWGSSHQLPPSSGLKTIKSRLSGRVIIPAIDYDICDFEQWLTISSRYRPTILYGYPSIISDYATWLINKGYETKGVKGVFTTAEMLLPAHRIAMETAFRCKVFNQYGSREVPGIACECPLGNMHLFIDNNIVEFLPDDSAGNSLKRIIVTPLQKYAQPLLRYELGDLGEARTDYCPCGRGYPLMTNLAGRDRDHLISPQGRKIYPGFFTRLMDGKDWIRAFQFRQSHAKHINLLIEISGTIDAQFLLTQTKSELKAKISEKMGTDFDIDIRIVEKIERTALGKFRYVINDMQQDR